MRLQNRLLVPLVSILVPCFNAERWLAETLESALAQTWPRKEIIVVNDGSTDNSLQILRRYETLGIKLIDQPKSGASAARNRALTVAQGDFIEFLDADDLLAPNKIEIQMRRLVDEEPGRLASGAWVRFYDQPHAVKFQPDPIWTDLDPIDWLVSSWSGGGDMHVAAWLTPRSVIERAGRWDEIPCPNDDGEFFTRVILNSSGVAFCNEARSYYRSGISDSLGSQRSAGMLSATLRSLELSTEQLLLRENTIRTRAACAVRFQRFVYDVYPEMPDLILKAENRIEFLGGASLKLEGGGKVFRFLLHTLGWKPAKRLQRSYGYLKRLQTGELKKQKALG